MRKATQCRDPFVADMNPFDLASASEQTDQPVGTVTDHAINPFDSRRSEISAN
jgi:hypothetical protein